jgi:UPF0755 protein
MRRALALVCAVLVCAGAMAGAWLAQGLAPRDAAGAVQLFPVARGSTLSRVGTDLEAAGLVRSALAFQILGRWERAAPKLHWGEYELSAAMTPREILALMVDGRVKTWDVTLPEGLTAREIADRLAAAGVADRAGIEALLRDPASAERFGVEGPGLEGYLFPDTYRLPRGLATNEIVRTLIDRFRKAWQPLAPLAAAQGLSQRQVVTLASIVEKETGLAAERPLVASVFRNRLRLGMRLESDPTVIYGLAGFDGNLRRIHLDDGANPYNTYQIVGLPPGPIASPGEAALRAVLDPAATEYLFFVGRGDGSHVFSQRYDDHVRAVNQYQRRSSR